MEKMFATQISIRSHCALAKGKITGVNAMLDSFGTAKFAYVGFILRKPKKIAMFCISLVFNIIFNQNLSDGTK